MNEITDEMMDKYYLQSNPYENYGKSTIANCECCDADLIEGDEAYTYDGNIYCSKECLLGNVDYYKITLEKEEVWQQD